MSRLLRCGLHAAVASGAFLTLLLFDRSAFQTFREPKVLATLFLAGVCLIGWGLLLAIQSIRRRPPSLPPLPLVALIPVLVIVLNRVQEVFATAGGGTFESEAIPLKVHYYLHILLPAVAWLGLFGAAAVLLRRTLDQSRLLLVVFAAFTLETGVVVLEIVENQTGLRVNPVAALSQAEIDVFGQTVKERIFGTIGNPNWVAGYLAVALFPLVAWTLTARSRLSRLFLFAILGAGLFALAATRSKGAFLALAAGGLHFGIVAFLSRRRRIRNGEKRPGPVRIPRVAVAVLLAAALGGGFYLAARTSTTEGASYLDHWAETLALRGDSITVRALLAHTGFQMWRESPWVGLGPGEFKTQFVDALRGLVEGPDGEKFQTRVARLHSLRATHIHNEYLQTLVEFGVIGLVFVELFFIWCQCRAYGYIVNLKDRKEALLRIGLLSGVWAGFGGSFFDYPFHRPSQSFLLAVFLGAAVSIPAGWNTSRGSAPPGSVRRVVAAALALVFLLIGAGLVWQAQAKYLAQRLGFWGRTTLEIPGGDRSKAFEALVRAHGLAPGEGEYTLLIAYHHLVVRGDPNLAIRHIRRARETSDNPNRVLLEATAQLERNDLVNAARLIGFVEVLEPNRTGLEFLKGRLLQRQGNWEAACRAFLREVQNSRRDPERRSPNLEQAHLRLAGILEKELGQYEEAAKHYEEFLRLLGTRTPTYPEAQLRLGDLSRNRFHDLERAERYYREALDILRQSGATREAEEVEKTLEEIQNRRERFR